MNNMTFCILFHIQGSGKDDIEAPVRIVRFVLYLFESLLSLKYLLSYYDYNTKEVLIIGHFQTCPSPVAYCARASVLTDDAS